MGLGVATPTNTVYMEKWTHSTVYNTRWRKIKQEKKVEGGEEVSWDS